jgi:acetolactate synthase-1/2/3 large subunit
VTSPDQVTTAYEAAHAVQGPFLIDFRVQEEVNVFPMVATGAAVDEMIRRPKPAVVQPFSGVEPRF